MERVVVISSLLLVAFFLNCSQQVKVVEKPDGFQQQLMENRWQQISIIPKPMKMKKKRGTFVLTPQTKIYYESDDADIKYVIDFLLEKLTTATGYDLVAEKLISKTIPRNSIVLTTKKPSRKLGEEGYLFRVTPDHIIIRAVNPAGLFYGVQTLRQLFPVEIESDVPVTNVSWEVPCVAIKDKPRFSWRGAHLDVCRHFFPKEFVKKYIDILAMHKINIFHWHLTEDQGWRIEIKKYPKLTEIGAWRVDREGIHWNNREPQQPGEKATYGGYYTQEEIKEIVAYAQSRFITVVPEIEMPGHALAALAAYPQYSCFGGPFTVATGGYWPIKDIYCAGKEETFEFLENILDEVIPLFPGEFFHIGGDEAFKENWEKCPDCQRRIKEEGLKDVHELQSYFIHRIEKFLNSRGKRLVGWDEILEGGLAPNATVMSWRGIAGGIAAAKAGHDVVMSPTSHCYFDYYQAKYGEPLAIGGYLPLEKVYSFEPIPPHLSKSKRKHILGAQANVWTEYIPTPEHAEYMLLPRLCALAEVVWSPKKARHFQDFQNRMEKHYDRLAKMGVNYRVPTPPGFGGESVIFKETKIELKNPLRNTEIRYTLDGSEPTLTSLRYTKPIEIKGTTTVKARTVMPNGRMSHVVAHEFILVDKEKNGMMFKYFEGNWKKLPDFSELTPKKTGKCYTFNPDKIKLRTRYYGIQFHGYLKIDREGEYTFYTVSDDGSKLFVDGKLVVNNDGLHGSLEKSGKIVLKPGVYPLRVDYFQTGGGEELKVLYQGPNISKQPVSPAIILSHQDR